MSATFGVGALVILAGAVALGWFVTKGGRPRTRLWCILLGVATVITFGVLQVVQIYYRPPAVWLIGLAAAVLAAAALFIRIGKDVSWRGPRVVALVGMVLVVAAAFAFTSIAMPSGGLLHSALRYQGAADGGGTGLPGAARTRRADLHRVPAGDGGGLRRRRADPVRAVHADRACGSRSHSRRQSSATAGAPRSGPIRRRSRAARARPTTARSSGRRGPRHRSRARGRPCRLPREGSGRARWEAPAGGRR